MSQNETCFIMMRLFNNRYSITHSGYVGKFSIGTRFIDENLRFRVKKVMTTDCSLELFQRHRESVDWTASGVLVLGP